MRAAIEYCAVLVGSVSPVWGRKLRGVTYEEIVAETVRLRASKDEGRRK